MPSTKTSLRSIWLVILSTLFLATGQVLLKRGVAQASGIIATIFTPLVIIGAILYAIAGVLMTISLRGGDLSVLYPIISLGFVWVVLAGVIFLHEPISALQLGGTAAIIVGVSVIGRSR